MVCCVLDGGGGVPCRQGGGDRRGLAVHVWGVYRVIVLGKQ
jgi:hypothetical protein